MYNHNMTEKRERSIERVSRKLIVGFKDHVMGALETENEAKYINPWKCIELSQYEDGRKLYKYEYRPVNKKGKTDTQWQAIVESNQKSYNFKILKITRTKYLRDITAVEFGKNNHYFIEYSEYFTPLEQVKNVHIRTHPTIDISKARKLIMSMPHPRNEFRKQIEERAAYYFSSAVNAPRDGGVISIASDPRYKRYK